MTKKIDPEAPWCVYPEREDCRGCEHSYAPELSDGGCKFMDVANNNHVAECVQPWRYRCKGCKYNYVPELSDGGCMLTNRKPSLAEIVSDIENELREEKNNDE